MLSHMITYINMIHRYLGAFEYSYSWSSVEYSTVEFNQNYCENPNDD